MLPSRPGSPLIEIAEPERRMVPLTTMPRGAAAHPHPGCRAVHAHRPPGAAGGISEDSPEKPAYDRLKVIQLTARLSVPQIREWEFDRWEINGSPRSHNPASVIMTRDSEAVVFYRQT